MNLRTCRLCGQEKPLDEFNGRFRHGNYWYSHQCKECVRAANRENMRKNYRRYKKAEALKHYRKLAKSEAVTYLDDRDAMLRGEFIEQNFIILNQSQRKRVRDVLPVLVDLANSMLRPSAPYEVLEPDQRRRPDALV